MSTPKTKVRALKTRKESELERSWKDLQLRHATMPKFSSSIPGSTLKNPRHANPTQEKT